MHNEHFVDYVRYVNSFLGYVVANIYIYMNLQEAKVHLGSSFSVLTQLIIYSEVAKNKAFVYCGVYIQSQINLAF